MLFFKMLQKGRIEPFSCSQSISIFYAKISKDSWWHCKGLSLNRFFDWQPRSSTGVSKRVLAIPMRRVYECGSKIDWAILRNKRLQCDQVSLLTWFLYRKPKFGGQIRLIYPHSFMRFLRFSERSWSLKVSWCSIKFFSDLFIALKLAI